jgi:uncharacterized membrane protein
MIRGIAVLLMLGSMAAMAVDSRDIEVKVSVDGETVRVESSYLVEATPAEVWSVMTDFENMPRFVSNLKSSTVVSRNGDVVTVAQSGEAAYGLLKFAFQSVRELRLMPTRRIESRLVSGNMERYEGITELSDEGGRTRVVVRSVAVPGKWVPPVVGPLFIVREAREQLAEFRAEILRRKAASVQ